MIHQHLWLTDDILNVARRLAVAGSSALLHPTCVAHQAARRPMRMLVRDVIGNLDLGAAPTAAGVAMLEELPARLKLRRQGRRGRFLLGLRLCEPPRGRGGREARRRRGLLRPRLPTRPRRPRSPLR